MDINQNLLKLDNEEKLSGKAGYVDDIYMDDMLYARTCRATVARGKVKARKYPSLPEGYFIIDANDIKGNNYVDIIENDWVVFITDEVHYYGEALCLVVGPDRDQVDRLMKNIIIEYEEETPIYGEEEVMIHYDYVKGEKEVFDKPFRSFTQTYDTGYQEHVYIEPQGMVAYLEADQIVVKGSMQCPYYIKNALINTLGMSEDEIRVVQATTGGGFGGKEEYPSLISAHVALAALKTEKPVKLIFTREEDMAYTTKRHPSKISITGTVDREHNLTGVKVHVGLDGGAFLGLSGVVLQRALINIAGVYNIKNIIAEGDVYRTNTVPTGAFRGFGAPQMFFAIEMFMTHLARELGEDDLVFKLKHLVKQGDHTGTDGTFHDPIIMEELVEEALIVSDYEAKHKAYSAKSSHRGIGISLFLHGCGFTGSGEQDHIKAVVELEKLENNEINILVASVDMGQGVKTTFPKLVSSVMDLPVEQVHMNNPDTNLVPDSGPTVASRTMMVVGGILARAAKRLKDEWQDNTYQKVVERYKQPDYVKWDQDSLKGDAYPAYSFGVNVVEVEVDPLSYQVSLVGAHQVYDVGKAIDERILIGQAEGGFLQGISYGYLENMVNKDGRVYQKTVTDYIIPTAADTVWMSTKFIDNPFALGPYGAKGAGELTLIGGAPAVAMAVEQAIKGDVTSIPVTPEKIMEVMGSWQ